MITTQFLGVFLNWYSMLELFVNVRKEQPLIVLTPENLNSEEFVKIITILNEQKVIKLQFTTECTLNQTEYFLITLIQKELQAYILSINNLDFIISNQLIPELNLPKTIRRINSRIFKAELFIKSWDKRQLRTFTNSNVFCYCNHFISKIEIQNFD